MACPLPDRQDGPAAPRLGDDAPLPPEAWTEEGAPFLLLRSRWMTVLGEHLRDTQGRLLEYWRIEKADSAIVLPMFGQYLLMPPPAWRPGIAAATLDFPGGRVEPSEAPAQAARRALDRELGIAAEAIEDLQPLNGSGWAINSSFSNQRLFGFVARLAPQAEARVPARTRRVTAEPDAIRCLLDELSCLQCRAVLLHWWTATRG